MNPREERGLALADAAKISRNGKGWVVPSQVGTGRYNVTLDGDSPRCTCPDHELRGQKCKHIYAVQYTLEKEVSPNGETTINETVTQTETLKVTYNRNWPAYNDAQSGEKHRFAA